MLNSYSDFVLKNTWWSLFFHTHCVLASYVNVSIGYLSKNHQWRFIDISEQNDSETKCLQHPHSRLYICVEFSADCNRI